MRDNASLTRPAYIEADLAQIFSTEDIASFAALWLIFHRSRFGAADTPAIDCPLERWREAGSREGEAARDRLADQVQIALKVLGSGFLEANPDLAAKLKSGEVNLTVWFNELLRLVYRLIFLMVAEDRNLLQGRMRTLGVVVCRPSGDHDSRVSQVAEHGLVEQLVAHPPVETLDETVLHRLAWRDVVPFDPVLGTPPQDGVGSQFRAVVADDHAGLAAAFDQSRQFTRHTAP